MNKRLSSGTYVYATVTVILRVSLQGCWRMTARMTTHFVEKE